MQIVIPTYSWNFTNYAHICICVTPAAMPAVAAIMPLKKNKQHYGGPNYAWLVNVDILN